MSTVLFVDEGGGVEEREHLKRMAAKVAAAAAARKKRRKAMAKRRSMSPQKEVARRWRAGARVAIPTECTYEVGMRFDVTSNLDGTEEDPSASVTTHAPPSRCASDGIGLRLHGLLTSAERDDRCRRSCQEELEAEVPHIYISGLQIPSAATAFLKKHLPERKYAYRKDGKVVGLHSFSESIQVLRRIASKVWPGPVILHVAVGGSRSPSSMSLSSQAADAVPAASGAALSSSSSSSVATSLLSVPSTPEPASSPSPSPPTLPSSPLLLSGTLPSSPSTHFLALRCPCHPLAVKVSQEFYQTSKHLLVGRVMRRHRSRSDRDNPDDNKDDDADSSISYLLRAGDVRASTIQNRLCHQYRDATKSVEAILDGEANLEHFYVPPCEYGQPCGVSVWIDEGRRRIAVRGGRVQMRPSPPDLSAKEPLSPTAGNATAAPGVTTRQVSAKVISQALRFKAKTEKSRVVQAVLSKWVVEADDGI